jgi:hypothetical protein
MRRARLLFTLFALGLAGCASASYVSPNDPQYARSGAPRLGEPDLQPNNSYGRIMGGDGHSPG